MDQLDQINPNEGDFASEAFFNQGSLQQIQQPNGTSGLEAVGNVTLPTNPAVIQQLTRQWNSGCSDRVAWSRHGHIASISNDGTSVYLECLFFNRSSGAWDLTGRHTLTTIFEDAVSLAWSSTGGELIVVDTKGRTWVFHNSPVSINRLILVRQGRLDAVDEYSQLIGMAWLNQDRQDRPRNVVLHAAKNDSRWVHSNARAKPLGPYWHRAVAMVHRNGRLTICYQRGDMQYVKVTRQLGQSDDTLYTHAAFAPTVEGKMLVTLHACMGVISVYLVQFDWSEVKSNPEGQAALTIEAVSTCVSSLPTSSAALGGDAYDPDSWQLSHLEVVQTSDVEKAVQLSPVILAVSTGVNNSISIADPGYLVSSVIKKWAVTPVEQKLQSRFDDLPSKGANTSETSSIFTLERQPDKEEQVITTLRRIDGLHAVIITTQENRTDFLSSDDLSSVSYSASLTETTSMAQSGFAYPFTSTIHCPGFSPNACVRADVSPEGKTQIVGMEYQFQQVQLPQEPDPSTEVALASLNLSFARACWSNSTIDDILFCALRTVPPELIPTLVSGMYRTLFRDTEYIHEKTQGSELERVFHKQVMGKVMAYHAGLTAHCQGLITPATTGSGRCWPLTAQWAWLANNIRHTATILYMSLRDFQNLNTILSPEFTDMLCAQIKWGLGVVRFILNTILEVGDCESNPEIFMDEVGGTKPNNGAPAAGSGGIGRLGDTAGDGSQGLVALLLNCHWSRIFLIAFVRAVRAYAKVNEPKFRHQLQLLQCIQQQTNGKGISFQAIEAILEYRWAAVGDVEGNTAATATKQLQMMATGNVSEGYQGTVKALLSKLINSSAGLRAKMLIDRYRLFTDPVGLDYVFLNNEVIGCGGDADAVRFDIHRKRPILKGNIEDGGTGTGAGGGGTGLMVRKCGRCGSYSEDVNVPGREWPRQIASMMARCVCDGAWILEPWEAKV
ncbi:uncharacterized protein A1O9_07772 [Exophiala aquamarina CBS 119918]|uniref:Mediator of RNA polymerase II transcription subunit 16 n=1 Tax=Exophiala aquamarina CBS 119918 TaxID=1182545 RepID=A0A072P8J9_9EURO|nr:uncharacterized protein A1O9_07772 [Exophiala aquamarina CBS 119918]KEF56191.1 hypothetical protein A1O9_07772 [Exophiala aquamarina CBS 119918]